MAKTLIIPTKFTAVDKMSMVVAKMQRNVNQFSNKTEVALARINRAERRMTNGFKKATGVLGQFGLALGGLAVASEIATANIELDKSLKSLSAITGVTGSAFDEFAKEVDKVATSTKKFKGDVATAFEVVGSAKPELLASADALSKVTQATIILSKASGDDLQQSALNLTGVMNQFNLSAEQANRTINVLAAGSQAGSANIGQINESLSKFGAVANGANITLEQSVGLIETLAEKSLKGSDAGTALKGVILKLQKAGIGYASGQFDINDALEETNKKLAGLKTSKEKDAMINKLFGAENIVAGKIILSNIDKFESYTKSVTGTNVAFQQADINSSSLANRLQELTDSFKNAVTTTNSSNFAMNMAKDILLFLANNMQTVVSVLSGLILSFLAYKTAIIATRTVLTAFNIIQGITGAVTGVASIAIGKSKAALIAYNVAVKIAAAAQWLWNVAMNANPIGLIVLGIAAVIAMIYIAIKYWDNWKKYLFAAIEPVLFLVDGFKSMLQNWKNLISLFAKGDILGGIKQIGAMLAEQVLAPVEMVMRQLAKIPGMGAKFGGIAEKILETRKNLGLDVSYQEDRALNKDAERTAIETKNINKMTENKAIIDINDKTGAAKIRKNTGVPIKLARTL